MPVADSSARGVGYPPPVCVLSPSHHLRHWLNEDLGDAGRCFYQRVMGEVGVAHGCAGIRMPEQLLSFVKGVA